MGLFSLIGRALGWGGGRSRVERGNAPLDPRGTARTAAELATSFKILRASELVARSGPMAKFEDLRDEGAPIWFGADAPPAAVIFVSHRWESPAHPDPHGTQATAIRAFLTAVRDVDRARQSPAEERRAKVSSLLTHGVFQAAYFLQAGIAFGDSQAGAWRSRIDGGDILERIGVWYDFSSMAQDGPADLSLIPSLEWIHQLIGESTLLVLRRQDDDYDRRAWCAAEISSEPDRARAQCERIILRLDKLLEPFPLEDLVGVVDGSALSAHREAMAAGLGDWLDQPDQALARLHNLYLYLSELEDQRELPLFTSRRNPLLFLGQRTLLIEMIRRLGAVSDSDRRLRAKGRLEVNVAAEVIGAMRAAGLACSNPDDLLFTGLMILYARHRGAPRMAAFYGECIARYFERKSLTLARYREARDMSRIDVWFVFDDEPPDSPAWKPRRVRA